MACCDFCQFSFPLSGSVGRRRADWTDKGEADPWRLRIPIRSKTPSRDNRGLLLVSRSRWLGHCSRDNRFLKLNRFLRLNR